MTQRLYRDDPYLLEFEARVVGRREHEGRPAVVLDRTAFYAESGGQPWDLGRLGGASVLAVVDAGDAILHVLDRPLDEGATVRGQVDAARRRDHREQHHGQHLLSRAFVEVDERVAHRELPPGRGGVDDRPRPRGGRAHRPRGGAPRERDHLGRASGHGPRRVPRRSRRLSASPSPRKRATRCASWRPRASTSRPAAAPIRAPPRRSAWSWSWATSGTRAAAACASCAAIAPSRPSTCAPALLRDLAAVFSSSIEDLPAAGRRAADALVEGEKQRHLLLERALEGEAHRLLAREDARPAVVVATYDGWPAADLRLLAQKLTGVAPSVALLGSRADKAHLVFAQTPGPGPRHPRPPAPGRRPAWADAAAGKGDLAQGGGERIDLLDDALAAAARAVRGGVPAA